jgi:hypothetical protein
VAVPVAPLLHVPPVTDSVRVVVVAEQKTTAVDGVMAAGELATVTTTEAEQVPNE